MAEKISFYKCPYNNFPNHDHNRRMIDQSKSQEASSAPSIDTASYLIFNNMMTHSQRSLMKPPSFPFKLHEMLDETENLPCLKAIVSWQPHGRAFIVHNTTLFIQEANKRSFFKQSKYPSFQRQLNLYGFQRISTGLDKGAYYHKLFLRGKRDLSHNIQRMRIKGTKVRKPASPANEPDFYSLPRLVPNDHVGANQEGGPKNRVPCQTRPPNKSSVPPSAIALAHRDTAILRSSSIPLVPSGGSKRKDYTGMNCDEFAFPNQSPDMGSLQNCNVPEHTVQPFVLGGEGHLNTPMRSQSHVMDEQIHEESADLEHSQLRSNESWTGLEDLGGKPFSASSLVKTSSRQPDMPLVYHQRPRSGIARMVSASPDCTRQRDELDCDQESCKLARVKPLPDSTPFLLHLQLPTRSGQPTQFHGLTFAPATTGSCSPKIAPTVSKPQNDDGQAPDLLGQGRDGSSQPIPVKILPLMHDCLASEDDHEKYSFFDKALGDGHSLVLHNPSSWSSSRPKSNLGLDGLPADTELEDLIAFHMSTMDNNCSIG